MVGYNLKVMMDFAAEYDAIKTKTDITKIAITGSFYKLFSGDFEKFNNNVQDIFSILFMMLIMLKKKNPKYERKSASWIAKEVLSHEFNRALYNQKSEYKAMQRPEKDPLVYLMAIDAIGKSDYTKAISLMMIYTNKDFQDIIVSNEKIRYYLQKNLLMEGSFITIEDIANDNKNRAS